MSVEVNQVEKNVIHVGDIFLFKGKRGLFDFN